MTCSYDTQQATPVDIRLTTVGRLGGKEAFSRSAEIQEPLFVQSSSHSSVENTTIIYSRGSQKLQKTFRKVLYYSGEFILFIVNILVILTVTAVK